MFVIAHVSDTHVGNEDTDAVARCDRVLNHLLGMDPRPDVLVVTGDVADHGRPAEYAEARAWLDRWPGPLAVAIGNHDVRDAYRAGLGLEPTCVVEAGGARFLMLDSLISERHGVRVDEGLVTDESLAWLDAELGAHPEPSYVCLHHPPVTIGLELMDPIRLTNGEALGAVLGRHPHVRATLTGHAHTMATTTFAGRPLLLGGGVVSTVTADAESLPTLWYDAPPSFALHLVDDDGRITTHWRALGAQ